MDRSQDASPQSKARLAGIFYVLNILTGAGALVLAGRGLDALSDLSTLVATACYAAVTVLFYGLFKPVNATVSLIAALISIVGCVVGALRVFDIKLLPVSNLAFFGGYCLVIGWLIFRSTFLPRFLGVLMAIGGLGWLTFASRPLASALSPYNMAPGILVETALTVWLLVRGVDVAKWREKAQG